MSIFLTVLPRICMYMSTRDSSSRGIRLPDSVIIASCCSRRNQCEEVGIDYRGLPVHNITDIMIEDKWR